MATATATVQPALPRFMIASLFAVSKRAKPFGVASSSLTRAKEKPQEGEVISVGKGKSNDEGKVFPLDVKAGDSILFGKYSGTEIKIDGEEFLIMREEEVLGILKKK